MAHNTANDGVKFSYSFVWLIFGLLCLVSRYRQVKVVVNSVDTIETKRANINIKEQKYCQYLGITCIISRKRFKGIKLLF